MNGKRLLFFCVAALLVLTSVKVSHAQFGYGGMETNGDVDGIFVEVLGRHPQPNEFVKWRQAGFDNSQSLSEDQKGKLRNLLKLYLKNPDGAAERKSVIRLSYKRSFGREPSSEDSDYWTGEFLKGSSALGYTELMNSERQYLQNTGNVNERRQTINRAYGVALGRFPTTGDINYWLDRMTKEGSNFTDIVKAAINYGWGDKPENELELRETIKRAYVAAGNKNPSTQDINIVQVKMKAKPRVFAEIVELIKKLGGPTKID
jgi:hypothetical protein